MQSLAGCSTTDEGPVIESLEEFHLHNANKDVAKTADISEQVMQKSFRNVEMLVKYPMPPDLA